MAGLTDIQRLKAHSLMEQGKSIDDIAKALGVSSIQVALAVSSKIPPTKVDVLPTIKQLNFQPSKTLVQPERGDIFIGTAPDGERLFWSPKKTPNPHLMLVGTSGSGKTYGIIGLISELSRQKFASIIVDYSKSYTLGVFPEKIRNSKSFCEINVALKGVALNPLQIRSNDVKGPTTVAFRVAGTFNRIYNIGIQQRSLLVDVILSVYAKRGITEGNPETWTKPSPFLSDVDNELLLMSEDDHEPRRKLAETTRAHLSDFFMCRVFRPDGIKFRWDDAINNGSITVLQLAGIEGEPLKVVAEFLLWDLYGFMSARGENPLSVFVILDECHNLKFKQDAPVDKVVREARKFGLGAMLASQFPEDFSPYVFGITATKLCFQVADAKGTLSKSIGSIVHKDPNQIKNELASLGKQKAMLVSQNKDILCKVPSFEERGLK